MGFSGFSCHTRNRPFSQTVGWHYGLDDLLYDIIFNILLMLPMKSLLQCRCVCKTWCSIIDSPHFAHLRLTSPVAASAEKHQLMLLEMNNFNTMLWSLLKHDDNTNTLWCSQFPIPRIANPGKYWVESLGFGFFCIKDKWCERQIYLFHPLRGEILMLPPVIGQSHARMIVESYGLGMWFDSTKEEYKLVRVFKHRKGYIFGNSILGTEVYSLGTKSWRAISAVPPIPLSNSESVSANGDVHWKLVTRLPNGSKESMIITFDTRKEEFEFTPQPDFQSKHYVHFKLIDWKGSLAMVGSTSLRHIDIWLLKDYCKKEWAREYRISCEMLFTVYAKFGSRYWSPYDVIVAGVWEDGLIFVFMREYMFYYNTKTDNLTFMKPPCFNGSFLSCTRSLVSLKNYGNLITKEAGHWNVFDLTEHS